MHNLLIAAFFITIVLSPCIAALWTLTPAFGNEEAAKPRPAAPRVVPQAVEMQTAPVQEAVEEPVAPPTREGLLKCARSSQLRRFHVHHPGASGEVKLRSLRPLA